MRIGILCDQPTMAECLRSAVTQAQEHRRHLDGCERVRGDRSVRNGCAGSRADGRSHHRHRCHGRHETNHEVPVRAPFSS